MADDREAQRLISGLFDGDDQSQSLSASSSLGGTSSRGHVVERLKECWLAELVAPELLPFPGDVVGDLKERIRQQSERLEAGGVVQGRESSLLTNIAHQETDRLLYLIRSFLRARLHKIQQCPYYYTQTDGARGRLSPDEEAFARSYCELVHGHFLQSGLGTLPPEHRKIDENSAGTNMISTPNLNTHVFCRILEDVGDYEIDDNVNVFLAEGDLWVLRYSAIEPLLIEGKAILV